MRKEEYCKDDRSPVTDEPLWDTFRSTGSRRVFRELFMLWYSDLSRYAAYWLPDMSDAEEVVLDFFMHLWLHRTAVNISSTFKGYALMSVRNRCISKLRGGNMVFVGVEDIDPQRYVVYYSPIKIPYYMSVLHFFLKKLLFPNKRRII